MAKFSLPKVSKIALSTKKKIDRSARKPPEGGGLKSWEETVEVKIPENTKSSSAQKVPSGQATKAKKTEDNTSAYEKTISTTKVTAGEVGNDEKTIESKITEPIAKKSIKKVVSPKSISQKPKISEGTSKKTGVEPLAKDTDIHQLAVPLNSKEYAMYNKIIERVNNLRPAKMIRGTDIQRASIHLLAKMKAETILKAHHKALMPMKPSEISNNKIHPISVPLQNKEFVMFNKIIENVNGLGLPKKMRGTDVQRASIYLLENMKPERILKAYYVALMR